MSPHWPTQVMLYQKKPNEQTAIDNPQGHYLSGNLQNHCMSRHLLMSPGGQTLTEQIEEGSFYEINRSRLPPRTPSLLLQSIRVVMVTVKTGQNVTVRYPSTNSLETYFRDPSQNSYPIMDEKFIMGSQLAAEVLERRVPSREFTRNSTMKAFWFVQTLLTEAPPLPLSLCEPVKDVNSKLGTCMSRLQSSNIKSWGERRLVSYVKNVGKNSSNGRSSSRSIHPIAKKSKVQEEETEVRSIQSIVEKLKVQEEGEATAVHSSHPIVEKSNVQEEDEETAVVVRSEEIESSLNDDKQVSSIVHEEAEEIKMEIDSEVAQKILRPGKRKRKSYLKKKNSRTTGLAIVKTEKQDQDNFRWSTHRYENAKQELFSVMKAKGAETTNAISRHALRAEARKQIGDTGLLDHLLKHVVDNLAPGGAERFKRRWDSQGVMEYWLESADLDDIRKKAGVQDPYWTPPPGWQPGDPICSHSSNCAAVTSALKEELAQVRGEMQVMAAQKDKETLSNLSVLSSLGDVESLNPAMFKERYYDLLKEKARREEELLEISKLLKNIELLMKEKSGGLHG